MSYKYSVAISFLSEDEALALRFLAVLTPLLPLPVFVYRGRQTELTGKTFEEALSPVFELESRIVVVLYRPDWGMRGGTLIESRSLDRRRFRSKERFLLPILIEDCPNRTPWSGDLLDFDLSTLGFHSAIQAITRMVADHERQHTSPQGIDQPKLLARSGSQILVTAMRKMLCDAFVTTPGPFQGYFGSWETAEDSRRWQSAGGESTASKEVPRRPYYDTYWGYEAALRLAPEMMASWAPRTLRAIVAHFAGGRWLKVVRDYSFSSGPQKNIELAESVRHTARAAELALLLSASHRRGWEVAWDLIGEASVLQHTNGGWREFRDRVSPPALWATVYVHRLFSKLTVGADELPTDEREIFLEGSAPLIASSERFLAQKWKEDRWKLEGTPLWEEATAALLAEVGGFIRSDSLIADVYASLRSMLTPAGRISSERLALSDLPEAVLALRVAFGMKACGRNLAETDSRYRALVHWLPEELVPTQLTVYDIAFAAEVLDLRAGPWREPIAV